MSSRSEWLQRVANRRVAHHLRTVLAIGVGGTLLFGVLHAVLIVPIWRQLAAGLPFALFAAALMLWAYRELRAAGSLRARLSGGALFGAALWASLLPVTLFGAYLRYSGLHQQLRQLEPAIELSVAATTGALVGASWARSRRVSLALACCLTSLVIVMAGPVAVGRGLVERLLFLGFLPVYVGAGVVLAALTRTQSTLIAGCDPC